MSLEKIEKRIRDTGREEIEKIEISTENEIKRIRDEIDADALRAYREVREKREQETILISKRIISEAVMKKKKRIEEKKIEIVNKIFDIAKDRILNMNSEDKKKILKNLADEGKKQVKNPIVYVDKRYADLINANAKDINDFGVVVKSEDGMLSIDNTLSNVMKRLEPKLKPTIAKILFSG